MTISFPIVEFRKIPSPYNNVTSNSAMYEIICDVKNIPQNIPMDTNPRFQKTNSTVSKKIKNTLLNGKKNFYILNRGILLSADSVTYNHKNSMVDVTFSDLTVHGNVDGGHTYCVIKQCQDSLDYNQQFVRLEILTGIEDIFCQVAEARNTSIQVQEKSIAELEGQFAIIKSAISDEPYANNIAYKENAKEKIGIDFLLKILYMFNLEDVNTASNAISGYQAKRQCIQNYIDNYNTYGETISNPYYKMKNLIKTIFSCYDFLENHIGEYYNKYSNKKYGSLDCIKISDGNNQYVSKFYNNKIKYQSPYAFYAPLLYSLSALIDEKNGYYIWKCDPYIAIKQIGPELINSIVFAYKKNNTLFDVAKNKQMYELLYSKVKNYVLELNDK